MDVDSVLLSVRERDKWRRRMELLERSLVEVKDKRRKVERRLKSVKRELAQLGRVSDAILANTARYVSVQRDHASRSSQYIGR
jgi:uncharacterized coiled-coil DUF342 family protein